MRKLKELFQEVFIGTYNHDWAMVKHGDEKVYRVRETI